MNDHAATAERYLIGDNFAVNGRTAAQANRAFIRHQNTVKGGLTGQRHVGAAVYHIEQDIVPGHTTGQNDFGAPGKGKLTRNVKDEVCVCRSLESKCRPTAENEVLQSQHHRLARRTRDREILVIAEINGHLRSSGGEREGVGRRVHGLRDSVIELRVRAGIMVNGARDHGITILLKGTGRIII